MALPHLTVSSHAYEYFPDFLVAYFSDIEKQEECVNQTHKNFRF
jgi:hypothetical protein